MNSVLSFLVKLLPYISELYEMSKHDEAEAIKRIDAHVKAERARINKLLGK